MNELEKKEKEKQALEIKKVKNFFKILNTKEELDAWLYVYLDMRLPGETIYPGSNSSPLDVVWNIYKAVRDNEGKDFPGFILLSGRDCGKTVSASIAEALIMLHFGTTIAHMAAIRKQSEKATEYINKALNKWKKYYEANGWSKKTDNKTKMEFHSPDGKEPYLDVIIASLSGTNSSHTNIMCVGSSTKIIIKNDGFKLGTGRQGKTRDRITVSAKTLHKMLLEGKEVRALTFNHTSGAIEFKKVLKSFQTRKPLLDIRSSDGKRLKVSGDHPVFVLNKGYVQAKDLKIGDSLLRTKKSSAYGKDRIGTLICDLDAIQSRETPQEEYFNQVILGSLLGDGAVYRRTKLKHNAFFMEQHCPKQKEYLLWKKNILSQKLNIKEKVGYSGYRDAYDMVKIVSGNSPILNEWANFRSGDMSRAEDIGPLALAVWYMDDGSGGQKGLHFNSQGFTKEQNEKLSEIINRKFNLETKVLEYRKNSKTYWRISGSTIDQYKVYKICEKYWHPTMLYKFDALFKSMFRECRSCGITFSGTADGAHNSYHCRAAECRAIKKGALSVDTISSIAPSRNAETFDFTIEDNHNFFANTFLVHNCVDEIDVISDPRVLEEAKFIPSMLDGRYPLTVKLSTRKFAFGLMQRELEEAPKTGMRVLQWNFIDMTEKCDPDRYKPNSDGSMVSAFVAKDLPLRTITVDQASGMDETRLQEFEKVELYPGCLSCPLAPVCRGSLARRSTRAKGGFYKPIDMTIQKFKDTSPEVAAAQMLCLAPTSKGLIYPRFVDDPKDYNNSNTITVKQAYDRLVGENSVSEPTHALLMQEIVNLNLPINAGLDWGFTNEFSFAIFAEMPWGEVWMIDSFGQSELETDDKVATSLPYQEKYGVSKWWADTEDPSSRKTFTKKGMVCPDFKKDVSAGIEALRTLIVTSDGKRRLKIILPDEKDPDFMLVDNHRTVQFMKTHHFILDAQGNPTRKPADEKNGDKDRLDAMRYYAQNMHSAKGSRLLVGRDQKDKENRPESKLLPKKRTFEEDVAEHQAKLMQKVIKDSVKIDNSQPKTPKKRKGIVWNI